MAVTNISAQCGLTLDAGQDLFYCPGSNQVQLNASIGGPNLSGFSWSPTTGLDDPTSLTPRATISGPITYTLTAEAIDPSANLIINGDFEAGGVNFTTDYAPGSGGVFGLLSDEGEYAISTNSSLTHTNFNSCNDHTGGGNMMVVNGSGTANDNVWCQTVTVMPNTTYSFNAWLMSVLSQNPAQLQFSVNGTLLGNDFRASSTACAWNLFSETWGSGVATSAAICITNQNTGSSGNDFAIDDLFFGPVCTQTDEVEISEAVVVAEAGPTANLPCDLTAGGLQLDGTGSSEGANYFYEWTTTNGNIVSGATTLFPIVDAPGRYTITTRFDNGISLCSDDAFVIVNGNNTPTAVATPSTSTITCTNDMVTIFATGSSTGPNVSYEWVTTDGNIVSGRLSDQATIDQSGTYELVVTNSTQGCFAIAPVVVVADTTPAVPNITEPQPLTCTITSQRLDASGSVTGANSTFSWTTADGNIVSDANSSQPLIDAPGTYTLMIVNGDNGCPVLQDVVVGDGQPDLVINLENPPPLVCDNTELRINATGTTAGPNIRYAWSSRDGNIVSNANGQMPLIDAAGIYVLLLTDLTSGCTQQDSVMVTSGAGQPVIALQSPQPFTCARAQIMLNASGTSTGTDIVYGWASTNGEIVSGSDGLTPTVSGPGNYTFSVRDTAINCLSDTTFFIGANLTEPVADAGSGFILDCGTPTDTLDGRASDQGAGFSYNWATTDGIIVADTNTLRPVIGAPGAYTLTVTSAANGCSATSMAVVANDDNAPTVVISAPDTLTCSRSVIGLDAGASDPGLQIAWSGPDQGFENAPTGLNVAVRRAGTYTLQLTDSANGCSSSRSIVVAIDTLAPAVDAGLPLTLTCDPATSQLLGALPGPAADYLIGWTGSNAPVVGASNTVDPEVNAAGTYFFTVSDRNNGCTSTDSVRVNPTRPGPELALLTTGSVINCNVSSSQLEGIAPVETDVDLAWTTVSGTALSGVIGATATATGAGVYRLLGIRNSDGCRSDTTVAISENMTPPDVVITPPRPIDCNFRQRTIMAEAEDNFEYAWTTADGSILGDINGATLDVDGAGTYQLVVTDQLNGCRDSATVITQLDTLAPTAVILEPDTLTCRDDVLTLDGSQSDEDLEFSWTWGTNDGNFPEFVTDLTPEVDQAGTYFITVVNLTTGCRASDTVTVVADQARPVINAGPAEQTITCIDTVALLGADAGAMNGLNYQWTALEGIAPGSLNTPMTSVQTAGSYELLVTNNANGCTAADTVAVIADQEIPDAFIGPVRDLNCTVQERILIAAPGSPGQSVAFRWTTTDGNIVRQQGAVSVVVDQGGTYQLNTLNPRNGCQDSTTLTVGQDTLTPRLSPLPAAPLTCRNPIITLRANLIDTGTDFSANWLTENGNIRSGGDTPSPTIDAAGNYVLTVINRDNNCSATTSIVVTRNDIPPALSASLPEELNCRNLTTRLNATNATFGENFRIEWSTADGNLTDGINTLTPSADQPGTYNLMVTDEDTDCRSTLAVIVTQDITPPTVNLGAGFDLGCEVQPVLLDAGTGGTGPFSYEWTTTNGTIISGQDLGEPTIQGAGTYAVVVTDEHNFCSASAGITLIQNLLLGFDTERTTPTCLDPFGDILFTEFAGGTAPFLYSIDGGNSFSPGTRADSLNPGRYDLVVQDANGCETEAVVLIPNAPELDLFVDPRAVIELGDSYFINTRSNFADSSLTQISWSPALSLDCSDCFRPTASPTETTTYTVSVVSSDGCTATDSLQLVVDDLLRIYFPNGFSPNGDGLNDVFVPMGKPSVISSIQDFTIYDRWGEAVHNATDFLPNDPAFGWDGQLNGQPLNPAIFVYTATVAFVDGRVVTYRGDVVLMR